MADLVLSLFPGIGLLDMAFEQEGFCVVRGPDLLWGGDVRRFHPPAGRFGGVLGGPPCQPFSPLVHLIRANGYEPKHGNLIPEYERVVAESAAKWFLMEESPFAPLPVVAGYGTSDFVLNNCTLDAGDGLGLPQMRKRRFSFGMRHRSNVPDLRQWIQYAALELPDSGVNYGHEHTKNDSNPKPCEIVKALAVMSRAQEVPARIGGSGKEKACAVIAREAAGGISEEKAAWQRANKKSGLAPGNRRGRSWEECCALQGLPGNFLEEAPFTKQGKFMVLGNGVPLPMGRAIARAVTRALASLHTELA